MQVDTLAVALISAAAGVCLTTMATYVLDSRRAKLEARTQHAVRLWDIRKALFEEYLRSPAEALTALDGLWILAIETTRPDDPESERVRQAGKERLKARLAEVEGRILKIHASARLFFDKRALGVMS